MTLADGSVGSIGGEAALRNRMVRMYEDQTLETIAAKIVERANQADEHIIEAAMLIREARKRVEEGEAGENITWTAWAAKHITLGESRRRELQRIANAKDPRAELERIRSANRERAADFRARSNGLISNRDPEDRRDVTSVGPEGRDPGADQDATSTFAQQRKVQLKRTAARQRAKFVEIGKSLVTEKLAITSFDRKSKTPSEVGLAVLLACVDAEGATHVKTFVPDKYVLNLALAVVGRADEAEASHAGASSVSESRNNSINEAIQATRSQQRTSAGLNAAQPMPSGQLQQKMALFQG
jgi:hypothetical protein